MFYTFELLQLVAICLACVTVGYGLSMLMGKLDEGWRPFSKTRIVKFNVADPKIALGVQVGAVAGYYAASGKEKSYSDIVEEYLDRLETDNVK